MIDISTWISAFLDKLKAVFGERVWFVGLQGSYGRGEATENSDIDMVVILDELTAADIERYHAMLDTLPNRELLCGFPSGKEELLHWEPADLFQFYYDTKPLFGSLDALLPLIDEDAVKHAIKMGAGNIYHGCVHNMLYNHSEDVLKDLYKAAFFVVQAITFRRFGTYIGDRQELIETVGGVDRQILETSFHLRNGATVDFAPMSQMLFHWVKLVIQQ